MVMTRIEEAILVLKSEAEVDAFLRIVLSAREREWTEHRWRAVQMSLAGDPQREIGKQLKISVNTVGRGSLVARTHGKFIRSMLDRIMRERRRPSSIPETEKVGKPGQLQFGNGSS